MLHHKHPQRSETPAWCDVHNALFTVREKSHFKHVLGQILSVQESVETAAAVLEDSWFADPPQNFGSHRLKHLTVQQHLTQASHHDSGDQGISQNLALSQMSLDDIHRIRAQKAAVVRLQMLPALLHLHLGLQDSDDVLPDLSVLNLVVGLFILRSADQSAI